MRTCITADHVLGYQNGEHVLIPRRHVVYENDQIIYIGSDYHGPADETLVQLAFHDITTYMPIASEIHT